MRVKLFACNPTCGSGLAEFVLLPATTESSGHGRGAVSPSLIEYGRTNVSITRSCVYDLSGDCLVNAVDLGFFAPSWMKCSGQAGYDPQADFDCDGCVRAGDIGWLATAWMKSCGGPAVVFAPCRQCGGPVGALLGADPSAQVQFTFRFRRELSDSETADTLAPALGLPMAPGSICYVEFWARDLEPSSSGLVAAFTDLQIKTDRLQPDGVIAGTNFNLFSSGSIDGGTVSVLGGVNLTSGVGVGSWVRVASVRCQAVQPVTLSARLISMIPATDEPAARLGSGGVPVTQVEVLSSVGPILPR